MTAEPWTIERICDALGSPDLSQRFLSQINRAPADKLLQVFADWQQVAEETLAAVERGRQIAEAEVRSEEPPGRWIDRTDEILAEAAKIRSRGAA